MALGAGAIVGDQHVQIDGLVSHAAATATEKKLLWHVPINCRVTGIDYIPSAAITGVDTNTTHINILDGGTDGTGTTEIANIDFVSGVNGVKDDAQAFTVTATNMSAGDVLILQYEKVGTGLALPIGSAMITYHAGQG